MAKENRVAIIVLNWNGFDDTVECLNSLRDQDYDNYKVILVDNGSDNNEGDRLKELFPGIYLIRNRTNRGFAGGNNDGINWALENGFDYIVNLNNDCIVERGWLSALVRGIRDANADFGSSRIMFYPDTGLICSDGDLIFPDGAAVPENRYKKFSGGGARRIFSACGAGSVYSGRCLRDVRIKKNQFFDELYFAFYEDVDLGLRLNIKSYRGVSIPEAVVYHKHSRTAGEYSRFKIFHSEKNRILNEILNYPVHLIFLGELFFALKLFLLLACSVFNRGSKGHRYLKNLRAADILILLIKARLWIAFNLLSILEDRLERKKRGFIRGRISSFFCWDILKAAS